MRHALTMSLGAVTVCPSVVVMSLPTRPPITAFACCILLSRVSLPAAAEQESNSSGASILIEETDESFDLRAGFTVAKGVAGQPARILFAGGEGNAAVALKLTPSRVAVVGAGTDTALASTPLRLGEGKHKLHLKRRGGSLIAIVDGRNVLRAQMPGGGAGPMQLIGGTGLPWDAEPTYQPVDALHLTDDFMTASRENSPWEPISGTWQLAGVSRPEKATDPFRMLGFAAANGVTICSNTYWFWSDYRVEAAGALEGGAGGLGVVFGYRGPKDYFAFRWRSAKPGGEGQLQLVHCHRGKEVLLNRKPAWLAGRQWYRLAVQTEGKRMVATVDGSPVMEARSEWLTGGQAGLYVEGEGGATFDDFVVTDEPEDEGDPADPFSTWNAQTKDFTDDPYMTAWANPARAWEKRAEDGTDWHWYRGLFFESAAVHWRAGAGGKVKPPPALCLMSEEGTTALGYRVDLSSGAEGEVVVSRNGMEVARGKGPVEPPSELRVSAERGELLVEADGTCLLRWTDERPLSRGRTGVVFGTGSVSRRKFESVALTSANWIDYRFDGAPVDWEVESGEWRPTNRWACVPGWNFFGGRGRPLATLWNKRRFGTDLHLDAFVAPMEGTSDRMHFAFPINLNLTFCATGRKLGSGYSLVYRAQDQSTLLFRKGELVAETTDLVRPGWRKRQMEVYYAVTQTWQHLEVLKTGSRIQVFAEVPTDAQKVLDRKLLIEYEDPQPLTGGALAFWTYGDNGMAMARVRVASPTLSPPEPCFLKPPPASDEPGVFVNAQNGGRMRTDLIGEPFDAAAKSAVRFRYRADPGTNVALYAESHNQRFRFDFLGDAEADGDSVVLGKLSGKADGKWHTLAVPLLQRLRTFDPNATPLTVDRLYVANLSSLPEWVGGIKGNARGTRYAVAEVSFAAAAVHEGKAPRAAQANGKQPLPAPLVSTCFGPARVDTFEHDTGRWRTVGGEQGAALWRDSSTAAEGAFSLRLYHRELAGPFAAEAGLGTFDVRRYPLVCFDYRIDDGTELNLFVESAGRLHEVRMLDDLATWPVIGQVPDMKADGQWHRAEVDFGAMLKAKRLPSPIIDRLLFGDAGWMNNIQDVQWHLDNFQLVPAVPVGEPEALQWSADGAVAYSWSFDASPTTVPDETADGDATGVALPDHATATYFHVRAQDAAGKWGPPTHFRFARQTETVPPPSVTTCVPAEGAEGTSPRVSVTFAPPDAIDIESLELMVAMGEQSIAVRHDGAGVGLDLAKGTFAWDGSRDDIAGNWSAQGKVECSLSYRGLSEVDAHEHKWSWQLNRAPDKQGPPAPYVSYVPTNRLCRYGFEDGDFGDAGIRRSAWAIIDDANPAATGSGSLRSLNLEANDFFSTYLRKIPFAVHDYPRVAFDYRFEHSGCNLILCSLVNGDLQVIDFAGQNTSYHVFRENRIGTVGHTKQDGKWRHVDFDMRAMLSKRYPQTTRFLAKYLGTWATGARTTYDNPQGVSHWLDNITVYSPRSDSAAFEWQVPKDANGIAGYAYVLDQKSDTVPPAEVKTTGLECKLDGLAPGTWHFHVRAVDRAGNWGETSHVAFELQQ